MANHNPSQRYNLIETNTNSMCQGYLDSMITNGFLPKITLPTKINRNSCKLYDHIFTRIKNTSIKSDSCIFLTNISDHLPVFLSLNFMKNHDTRPTYIEKRDKSASVVTVGAWVSTRNVRVRASGLLPLV